MLYWDNYDYLPTRRRGAALREDGARLYSYDYTSKKERLMCDFSLEAGDTIRTYADFDFIVTRTGDTVLPFGSGETLRFLEVDNLDNPGGPFKDFWVEKIGALSVGIDWPGCWMCPGGVHGLSCCREADEQLFREKDQCLSFSTIETYKGKIAFVSNPPVNVRSDGEDLQLWAILETESTHTALYRMALMHNGRYFAGEMVLNGEIYQEGDEVEIQGIRSTYVPNCSELEIVSIKRAEESSIENMEQTSILLQPNPAREVITITAQGGQMEQVEILDVNGKVLYRAENLNTQRFTYKVGGLAKGLYLARVKTSYGAETLKFVVR